MRRLLFILALSIPFFEVIAQPYTGNRHTRHRFAQLTLGAGLRAIPSQGLESYGDDPIEFEPCFHIGGTHFWGHSEFYIDIPLVESGVFSGGVETGMRLFPWPVENGKLRPYFRASMNVTELQIADGAAYSQLVFPLGLGITYSRRNWILDAGWSLTSQRQVSYYSSLNTATKVSLPNSWFSIGINKMLETTLSAERSWRDSSIFKITEKLAAQRRLNGFTIAAGISSAWLLEPIAFNEEFHSYFHHQVAFAPFADLGLGYYHHTSDMQLNIAYRGYTLKHQAYGKEQSLRRRSIGLEVFKFLADYHGFVPFVGGIISYEGLRLRDPLANQESGDLAGGISFGWDIRPNRVQTFILRTNLRYYPKLSIEMEGRPEFNLGQIEFNFIQLVIFPERMMGFR